MIKDTLQRRMVEAPWRTQDGRKTNRGARTGSISSTNRRSARLVISHTQIRPFKTLLSPLGT